MCRLVKKINNAFLDICQAIVKRHIWQKHIFTKRTTLSLKQMHYFVSRESQLMMKIKLLTYNNTILSQSAGTMTFIHLGEMAS